MSTVALTPPTSGSRLAIAALTASRKLSVPASGRTSFRVAFRIGEGASVLKSLLASVLKSLLASVLKSLLASVLKSLLASVLKSLLASVLKSLLASVLP